MRAIHSSVGLILCAAAFAAAVACSSTTPPVTPPNDAGTGTGTPDGFPEIDASDVDLLMLPEQSYTGFDGVHAFKVPVSVYRAGPDLVVTVSDPSVADVKAATYVNPQEDVGQYYLVTPKKAGQVTITAKSGRKTVTATLTVQPYSPARYTAGDTRYKNASGGQAACASCHTRADGADHSPTALSAATDEEITTTITAGIKSGNVPITSVAHTWTATQAELDGLVSYLRALPPKGYTEK